MEQKSIHSVQPTLYPTWHLEGGYCLFFFSYAALNVFECWQLCVWRVGGLAIQY